MKTPKRRNAVRHEISKWFAGNNTTQKDAISYIMAEHNMSELNAKCHYMLTLLKWTSGYVNHDEQWVFSLPFSVVDDMERSPSEEIVEADFWNKGYKIYKN